MAELEGVTRRVVDVLEAVAAQEDPAEPASDNHENVLHLQDLKQRQTEFGLKDFVHNKQ